MRKILIGLGILITLVAIAALALPSLIPASVYKTKIEQQVSAKLGRNVTIAGDVKLSVFPSLSANAKSVTIENGAGFSSAPFITMESLQANVKLMPLLKKQVEISNFTLIKPKISLEKLKNGDVNWSFSEKNTSVTTQADSFKRDGRLADLQISLGQFTLKDGDIKYSDLMAGKSHSLKSVNMKVSMLGMDKPATAKGDLIIDGIAVSIDTRLETPKAFLNGQIAPFFIDLKSDLITMTANGKFTASEHLTFDAIFDVDVPSISKLDKPLGIQNPYGALSEIVKLKADLSFDGTSMRAKNAALSLSSNMITTNFNGDFVAGPKPTASGDLSVNISDLFGLQKTLGFNYPQTAIVSSLNLSTKLTTNGTTTQGENIAFNLRGDGISADYKGSAKFENALSLDGNFSANSPSLSALTIKLGMSAVKRSEVIGDFAVSGRVSGLIDKLSLTGIDFKTKGSQLNATYQGDVKLDQPLTLNGKFDAQSPSAQTLIEAFGLGKMAGVKALGKIDISGQISGPSDAIYIKSLNFKTENDLLTASYLGDITTGKTVSLNGNFKAFIPSVKNLSAQAGIMIPYVDALGSLNTKGTVSGAPDALVLSGLSTKLDGGLLNLQFDGTAKTGKVLSYEGELSTSITSIRKLATLGGTQLAASTTQGEIYGPFSLSGLAKGTAKDIRFSNASLRVDDIIGAGSFRANLMAAKPMLTGTLDLQGLNLRPYMVAQNPSGKIKPWSEEPLNLTVLNLFDADFALNTPNILVSRLEMGQSNIKTRVKNGVMTTNIPNVSLYGGTGDLDMAVNARQAATKVDLDFTLKNVDGNGFLGAAAGFTQLTGNTGTTMKFRGSGRTQAEIMRSLSGNGDFELAEGVVSGVDIGQFVGGLDSALSSGALPAGIGSTYTTPFNKLAGLFTINGGVLTVGDFSLNSETVRADGSGTLDIGRQKIDFSLQPKLLNATGLAGFGIPIRFTGNFGGVSAGLDTQLLGNIVAARAKQQLQNEITNRVGGGLDGVLGDVLGGVLGTPNNTGTQAPKAEQKPEGLLGDVLGGLLGTPTPQQAPTEEPKNEEPKPEEKKEEEKKQEDPLEKALKDLFGGN